MRENDPNDPMQAFREIEAHEALTERWRKAAQRARRALPPKLASERSMFIRWSFWVPVLGALGLGLLVGRQMSVAPAENPAFNATIERIVAKSE